MGIIKPLLFLATFALYIFTSYPSVAPYRDSGEMSTVTHTLGVAHPPGYPLYILVSKAVSCLIPFGNPAKKISAVSALFMAGSVTIFYSIMLLLLKSRTTGASIVASALSFAFGVSYLNWYLAIVQEMYTMGVFMVLAATYFMIKKDGALSFFILGVATGVRTDLVLILPAFVYYAITDDKSWRKKLSDLSKYLLFFVIGASVFFYSYIRALSQPLINWGDTSTISRLISSLMRRSHGGTLDLISAGYIPGENFPDGAAHYLTHIFRDYCGIPFVLVAVGIFYLWKNKKNLFIFFFIAWVISGWVFIYLANMPPNTHALAILEAHYLIPDIFLWLLTAVGFVYLVEKFKKRKYLPPLLSVVAAAAIFFQSVSFTDEGRQIGFFAKRNNYILEDYARCIRASAPPNSAIIVKEDVQVFTLWYEKYIAGKRPDITIVATGLSGSPWYQKLNEKSGVYFTRLSQTEEENWKDFIAINTAGGRRKIFFTNDVDLPPRGIAGYNIKPYGLLNYTFPSEKPSTVGDFAIASDMPYEFYTIRLDDPRYSSYREFFTPDIIEDYTKGWHQMAFELMRRNKFSSSRDYFLYALYLNGQNFPQSAFHLGWSYFSDGDYRKAFEYYDFATILYARYLKLANRYKAAAEIKNSIAKESAEVWLHRGVTAERLADDETALESYRTACDLYPGLAAGYYNTAVVYWKKRNFSLAAEYLKRTLAIEPTNVEARRYLSILESQPR